LNELLELLRRYGFQVHLFNLSLDITVPICLCLLEDTTGIKPYFTLGLRAQHNWNESIKGAILESLQSLIAFRDLTEMHGKCSSPILQRIIYWLDKKPKEALGFLFQGEIKTTITPVSSVFQCLHEAGIKKIYFRRIYNENGIVVIQAAVPELVQLPIGGRIDKTHINPRLFSVPVSLGFFKHVRTGKDLNTIPHPFP